MHQWTMNNQVVPAVVQGFLAAGLVVMRFNFRGVGASEGSYGDGLGEQADAKFVANWNANCSAK